MSTPARTQPGLLNFVGTPIIVSGLPNGQVTIPAGAPGTPVEFQDYRPHRNAEKTDFFILYNQAGTLSVFLVTNGVAILHQTFVVAPSGTAETVIEVAHGTSLGDIRVTLNNTDNNAAPARIRATHTGQGGSGYGGSQ